MAALCAVEEGAPPSLAQMSLGLSAAVDALGGLLHPQLASQLSRLANALQAHAAQLDAALEGWSASELIGATVAATLLAQLVARLVRGCLRRDLKRAAFRCAIRLPIVRGIAAKETEKETGQLWEKYHSRRQGSMQTLPEEGLGREEILRRLQQGEAASRKWFLEDGARLSGAVYSADPAHWDLVSAVMRMYALRTTLVCASLSLSLSLSLSPSVCLSLALSASPTHPPSLPPSLTHSLTQYVCVCVCVGVCVGGGVWWGGGWGV